jgi:hypothetical protein
MLPDRSEDEYNFMRAVLRGQLRCLPRGYIFPTSADVYFRFFLWLSKYFTGNNKTVLNCATVVLMSLKI